MGHGITEYDHMVSAGGIVPWHGLGTVLPSEKLDSREALVYAKLDNWDLRKEPVYVQLDDGTYGQVMNRWGIVRYKDRMPLSATVGDGYTIFSNEDAFAWFDNLLGEGFHYETAGSLNGGTTVWILAKAPFNLDLPDSEIGFWTLLKTSHDGSSSIQALNTPVRVVCNNTLGSALSTANRIVRVNHTRNASERLHQAMVYLGFANAAKKELEAKADAMTQAKISNTEWEAFLNSLVKVPTDEGRARTVALKTHDKINELYFASGESEIRGTVWGAYNAVVAYHNHEMTGRSKINTPAENRFQRIMFGGSNITDRALALLS